MSRWARLAIPLMALIGAVVVGGGRGLALDTSRREPTRTTLTALPAFPRVPLLGQFKSREEKEALRHQVIDHKLSTYPRDPRPEKRPGRHRTSPFAAIEPREDQVAVVARNYDMITLPATKAHLVPLFRRHNPSIRIYMYFYGGLTPGIRLMDAGNVDSENTSWILKNHPDWLLLDGEGRPLRAASSKSPDGAFWGDPGNREWQEFFARKLSKALAMTGDDWDGILLDEFFGHRRGFRVYAGASEPAGYPSDEDFQESQLDFLRNITSAVDVPVVPNLEAESIIDYPDFFAKVLSLAGGAQSEVFTLSGADHRYGWFDEKTVKSVLDLAAGAPPGKVVIVGGNPANLGGDIDATLHEYFVFLLIADRKKDLYWSYKEGSASVPHYWYREYDLDLGPPLEQMQVVGRLWKRAFENAVVLVNQTSAPQTYTVAGKYFDVLGRGVSGPVKLGPRTSTLLVKNKEVLR